MARLMDLIGNAQKMDMKRVANGEKVPKRGKKKHYTQMTSEEKKFLFNKLKSVKKWRIGGHALDRMKEKNIEVTYNDIVSTIYNSNIIEYHTVKLNNFNDRRVLLRSKAITNGEYNLHVVYSITGRRVVSVWLNNIDDLHNTIDMRDYDSDMKIFF